VSFGTRTSRRQQQCVRSLCKRKRCDSRYVRLTSRQAKRLKCLLIWKPIRLSAKVRVSRIDKVTSFTFQIKFIWFTNVLFLFEVMSEDTSNRKRQRTYLITDTPDHKQNSTIIMTKQEKVRKRFSFQPMSSFPVVPDTPVKGKSELPETTSNSSYHVIASSFPIRNHIEVTPKKYSSPRKHSHLLD